MIRTIGLLLVLSLAACSSTVPTKPGSMVMARNMNWLSDGTIEVARPIPQIEYPSVPTLLGFLPVDLEQNEYWLAIDRSTQTVTLMDRAATVREFQVRAPITSMTAGRFKIQHKQDSPLWYADDNYYRERLLDIPEEGSKERFLRGALGSKALFLDINSPIYSPPLWSEAVGGIALSSEQLEELYSLLEVGAYVEVS